MNIKKPPFNPDSVFQNALSFHRSGQFSAAAGLYKRLLDYFPNQTEVLTPLGTLLLQQGKHEEGVRQIEKSLKINPNQPDALYNLAVEFQKYNRLEDAKKCYERAVLLNPKDVNTYLNLGNTLKDMKRYQEALANYDNALTLCPDMASVLWNKGLIKILIGEFEEGWQLYEWGWKCSERGKNRTFIQPKWLGKEQVAGKTLLIHSEQGLGDVIQFCRYIPMLEKLGAEVILEIKATLVPLVSTLKCNLKIIEDGMELPNFDMYCPIMSMPLAFKTSINTIPHEVPYLYCDSDKIKVWHKKLGSKTKLRIGFVWSGSKTHKNDRNRSISLETFEPILQLPFEFHSIQKQIDSQEEAYLSKFQNVSLHQNDLLDFSDTAALLSQMDLTISVDTSVAHLAGALGKSLWLMLPFNPDYRWMVDGEISPWYPTMTLFRQTDIGNWNKVISDIKRQLILFLGEN